jgi:hypothetical protein
LAAVVDSSTTIAFVEIIASDRIRLSSSHEARDCQFARVPA